MINPITTDTDKWSEISVSIGDSSQHGSCNACFYGSAKCGESNDTGFGTTAKEAFEDWQLENAVTPCES